MIFKNINLTKIISQYSQLNKAVERYNNIQSKSQSFQTAYNNTLQKSQSNMGMYLASLNGAKASITGYVKYLISAKASTVALQLATNAMNIALKAGGIVGVSLLVNQINKWIHTQEEARQKSIELTNVYKEQRSSLDEQIEKYKELKKELDSGNLSVNESRSIKEQLLEIQKNLIESYGDEVSNIDLVNGKYKEQLGLLSALSKEKASTYVKENRSAYEDAKKELEKTRSYKIGSIFSYESREGMSDEQKQLYEYIKSYSDLFEIRSMYDTSTFRNSDYAPTLFVNANADEAKVIIDKFYDDIEKYIKDNNLQLDYDSLQIDLSKISSDIETNEKLKEYREIYDEFMKAEVVRNDILRPLYQDSIQAVEDYNNALSTGEGIEEAKAKLDSLRQSIQSATGEMENSHDYQDVFDGIYDGINKTAESAYELDQAFKNDTTVQGYAEQLRGLMTVDLKNIRFDNDNLETGEQAFKNLLEVLGYTDPTQEQIQNLINKLEELGYVIGDATKPSYDVFHFDQSAFNKEIESYEDGYSKLIKAQEEWNESKAISHSTFVDLEESGLLEYIQFTSEGLEVNTEKLLENAQSTKDKAVADLHAAMTSDLLAIAMGSTESISAEAQNVIAQLGENTETAGNQAMSSVSQWATLGDTISQVMADIKGEDNVSGISEEQKKQMSAVYDFYKNLATDISNIDITLGGSGSGSKSKSTKDTKETFDWIETIISRIQRTITNLGKTVSATYKKWSTRNNALAQEMSAVSQEIATQQNAYDAYMKKANSVNLSEHYKELVRNGGLRVEDITDETIQENIKNYKEWYEKALSCSDAITDLQDSLASLAMTKFDNISKQYDDRIAMIEHHTSMLEGYVNRAEVSGFWASEVYYQKLAETELDNINQLQSQYNDLITAFNTNVNNGSIEKYSEDWYSMYEAINDTEEAIQSANTALIEYNQTLQQIRWDLFDRSSDYKNALTEEGNFLIDMLDNYELFNKDGSMTNHGLSVQGLHAMNYNVYMEESAAYAKELQKINEEIANDPHDLELIDRRNELLNLQQEAIRNAMSEKEAIKDLAKNGFDKMLDSLQELIDKRKEALNAEKDLYDYQNSIKEKTDTISNYKKQLQSYAGDNSEEAKATIQKLQISLAKAEKDLAETEYEKWLSDQEALLDDLYDQTSEWINARLDNIDGLVYEAIVATNTNASTISNTLNEVTNALGYTLSTNMAAIWNAENAALNGVYNVVKTYGDILYGTQNTINNSINGGITTVQNALKTIDNDILKMIEVLNAQAKTQAESIAKTQQQSASSQSNNNSNSSNNTSVSTPTPEPTSNKITLNGGLFYENSYKGGKTGNSVSQWTGHEVEITGTSKTGMVHIVDKTTGTILGWVDPKQLNGYATGTINAKKGFNLISEAGDEIVLDNHGNAVLASGTQLYPFEGGETVFNAAKTAEILRNNLVPLNEQSFLSGMVKKPNYSALQGLHRSSGHISNDIKMNITLPNVTDYDSFVTQLKHDKRFEKLVQNLTIDRALNKNSLSKNKL